MDLKTLEGHKEAIIHKNLKSLNANAPEHAPFKYEAIVTWLRYRKQKVFRTFEDAAVWAAAVEPDSNWLKERL